MAEILRSTAGVPFSGTKQTGREYHRTPGNAEVKNAWKCTSSPPYVLWWCLISTRMACLVRLVCWYTNTMFPHCRQIHRRVSVVTIILATKLINRTHWEDKRMYFTREKYEWRRVHRIWTLHITGTPCPTGEFAANDRRYTSWNRVMHRCGNVWTF